MKVLGTEISSHLLNELNDSKILENRKLVVMSVGNNSSAMSYLKGIQNRANELGVIIDHANFSEDIDLETFIDHIKYYNGSDCSGIMLLTPFPSHLSVEKLGNAINPLKDVDCLNQYNTGKFYISNDIDEIGPCTAKAVLKFITVNNIDVEGLEVCIVGASNIVGKPTAKLFLDLNATVTVCNASTRDLESQCKKADIVVSCAGVAKLIKPSMLKSDAIVIDVGINFVDGKMCGDVDYDGCIKVSSNITPVPRGVGSVTSVMIFDNLARLISKN